MTDITSGINRFNITRRINDAGMQFDASFSNDEQPDKFRSGNNIEITLNDPSTINGLTVFKGRIQTVKRNHLNSNKIFGITGRHIGYYLLRQRFNWRCNFPTQGASGLLFVDYGPQNVLQRIFENTGIKIARNIPYANICTPLWGYADAYYCGEFKTKKEAIDALFTQYARATYGASYKAHKFVWYIDIDGWFKWFETHENRGNITNISNDHPQLVSLDITEDNTNLVNSLDGYAGTNSNIHRKVTDTASINQHGLLEGEPLVDTSINNGDDLLTLLNESLANTKDPLHTATANFDGLFYVEPGQKIKFTESDAYSDVEFTVVDITISGSPENHNTSINFSTDVSVLSADNTFEIMKAIIEQTVPKVETATVLYGTNNGMASVQTRTGGQLNVGCLDTCNDGDTVVLIKTNTGVVSVRGNIDSGSV